ncbi:hypothetical protein MBANPS3_003957 [Mucor bainieri]
MADKANVTSLYDRLDRNKMWKLSTGTLVEERMCQVALAMDHEHPSHSLILDITDKCWDDVFTDNEKEEIRSFRVTELPVMSVEVETYLAQLQNLSAAEVCEKVDLHAFPLESDTNWVQKSYRAFPQPKWLCPNFDLVVLESLLIKMRFVLCALVSFPYKVKQRQILSNECGPVWTRALISVGEKCSKASADSANKERCLGEFGRQSSGRKMDYIFLTGSTEIELGCGECALVEGVKSTKELTDANFKMPKVMKDMANRILFTRSGMAHDLCLVGFYMGGAKMQLYTMDFPAGYVARWDGFGPVEFPKNEIRIGFDLPEVLKMVIKARWLLEDNISFVF